MNKVLVLVLVLVVMNGSFVLAQDRGGPGSAMSASATPAPVAAAVPNRAAENFADKAKEALYKADNATAVKMYDEAIKLDPKNAKYRYMKAMSLINLGNPAGALLELQIVIELDPQNKDAYGHLGKINYEMNDFRQCVIELDKGIKLFPNEAFLYYQRGQCYYQWADTFDNEDKAKQDLKKAAELDPSYAKHLKK